MPRALLPKLPIAATTASMTCGGFRSVEKGEVRLVATTFEYADEIDVARAEAAKARAEARIAAATEERDIKLARAKLSRALNRLHIAGK